MDDNSPDGTQEVVRQLQKAYGAKRIVRRPPLCTALPAPLCAILCCSLTGADGKSALAQLLRARPGKLGLGERPRLRLPCSRSLPLSLPSTEPEGNLVAVPVLCNGVSAAVWAQAECVCGVQAPPMCMACSTPAATSSSSWMLTCPITCARTRMQVPEMQTQSTHGRAKGCWGAERGRGRMSRVCGVAC